MSSQLATKFRSIYRGTHRTLEIHESLFFVVHFGDFVPWFWYGAEPRGRQQCGFRFAWWAVYFLQFLHDDG